jgi:hypothetical protein
MTLVPSSVRDGMPKKSLGALPPLKYSGLGPSKFSVNAAAKRESFSLHPARMIAVVSTQNIRFIGSRISSVKIGI